MGIDLRKIKVPKYRPDGIRVTKTPEKGTKPYKKGFKLKEKVYARTQALNRKWVSVTGYIVGFTRDDVLIYSNNTFLLG